MIISIINKAKGETARYAARELKHFLEKYTNAIVSMEDGAGEDSAADRYFILDAGILAGEHEYMLRSGTYMDKKAVYITGGNESSLLAGTYELLRKMGLFFDIDGEILRDKFSLEAADDLDEIISPFCRLRGIRQHINFPMDISAYHLAEAVEYLRNLARMGMNAITFHSYTGQWHGYKKENEEVYAGNFFYGQRHPVPDYGPIKSVVRNRRDFCIPEVEGLINDNAARSEFAVWWLNKAIAAAKQVGMRVTLSIEFPQDAALPDLVQLVRNVLSIYPDIDAIEWITPEGGGAGEGFEFEEITQKVVSLFGDAVLDDGRLPYMPGSMPSALAGTLSNLKKAVDLYNIKDEIFNGISEKDIQIGLYVTEKETLKLVKNIMDRVLPGDVIRTFLPAHGSKAAADNIEFMGFSRENWQNTMVYSWIEFDGNMYLQQNSCDGIEQLIQTAVKDSGAASIHGICLNHWRTAENKFAIAYSAHVMITPTSTAEFYKLYGGIYDIGEKELLSGVLTKLGALDIYNRDRLFNIGFCYLGCWLWKKGLDWVRPWAVNDMEYSINVYNKLLSDLYKCLESAGSEKGRTWIRFMINRMECSILHIKAIRELRLIGDFADDEHPEYLTREQKDDVISRCEKAMDYAKAYIDRHVEIILDRGCEGSVVSYYATIPVFIDHIKQYFALGEEECHHIPGSFDQPPPPNNAFL